MFKIEELVQFYISTMLTSHLQNIVLRRIRVFQIQSSETTMPLVKALEGLYHIFAVCEINFEDLYLGQWNTASFHLVKTM